MRTSIGILRYLGNEDVEIEVEFQTDTIGSYLIEKQGNNFVLIAKQTGCLAKIKCNIPQAKQQLRLEELANANEGCCTRGGNCC